MGTFGVVLLWSKAIRSNWWAGVKFTKIRWRMCWKAEFKQHKTNKCSVRKQQVGLCCWSDLSGDWRKQLMQKEQMERGAHFTGSTLSGFVNYNITIHRWLQKPYFSVDGLHVHINLKWKYLNKFSVYILWYFPLIQPAVASVYFRHYQELRVWEVAALC